MSLTMHAPDLAYRLRALLEDLPDAAVPITYQQAAEALGLTPPRTIQRIALALEALMREDVASRPPDDRRPGSQPSWRPAPAGLLRAGRGTRPLSR